MSEVVTLAGYVVLVAGAVGLELRARRRPAAAFADAVDAVVRWQPARLVVLAGWLWLGWHLFVRVSR